MAWSDLSIATYLLIAARMAGMLFAAPFFGAKVITVRFRVVLCLIISFSVFPLIGNLNKIPFDGVGSLMSLAVGEFLVGALFGLAVHVVFKSMLFAGELIGAPMGLSQATEQGSESSTSTGKLFDVIAIASFVLVGGPGLLVGSIVDSMMMYPVGSGLPDSETMRQLINAVPYSFVLGLKIALPILICQMLAVFLVGIVSRSIPQLSMWQAGLPLTSAATLIGLLLAIGTVTVFFGEQMEITVSQFVKQFFHASRG